MKIDVIRDLCDISPDGCWLWKGKIRKDGYVRVVFRGKYEYMHRVAWSAKHGPIPDKMNIVHSCKARHCLNPKHLMLCTRSEQIEHAVKMGGDTYSLIRSVFSIRANRARGKLNMQAANEIRAQINEGHSIRSMSRKYGVTRRTIGKVVKYELWIPDILLRAMGR